MQSFNPLGKVYHVVLLISAAKAGDTIKAIHKPSNKYTHFNMTKLSQKNHPVYIQEYRVI
jgi:hypothetical protein